MTSSVQADAGREVNGAVTAGCPGRAREPAGGAVEPVAPLRLSVPARPGQLAGLRRRLREWMARAGIGEEEATTVQIAAGEAATNAVEHAYVDGEPGLVRVSASLSDGVLSVEVTDDGCWRPQSDSGQHRGRGLLLMRATMDDVDVVARPDGTTVTMRRAVTGPGRNRSAT